MTNATKLAAGMLVLAINLGCHSGANAAAGPNSPELNRCISSIKEGPNGSRWGPLQACQEQELTRQDRRLNAAYSRLTARAKELKGNALQRMVQGQRQWLAYRDQWCAFEASHDAPPNPAVNGLLCRIEITAQQTERLEEQVDELEGPRR